MELVKKLAQREDACREKGTAAAVGLAIDGGRGWRWKRGGADAGAPSARNGVGCVRRVWGDGGAVLAGAVRASDVGDDAQDGA